jgi:hypothetical protein
MPSTEASDSTPTESQSSSVYDQAIELATSAKNLADSAFSPDDWNLVESRWNQSVSYLEALPENDPNYAAAQAQLPTFRLSAMLASQGQALPDDPFPLAIETATRASQSTQTASIPSSWQAVSEDWQLAIALMQAVPADSPNFAAAQERVTQYQQNLAYATSNANKPVPVTTTTATTVTTNSTVSRRPARSSRSGSCDCPYDTDSAGRRCGNRSAYSKPGGSSPTCYVTE